MIISIKTSKAFEKLQHSFMIKNVHQLGMEENVLNLIQRIFEKSTVNTVLNGERLKAFSLKSGQVYLLWLLLFNMVQEFLVSTIGKKEEEGRKGRREEGLLGRKGRKKTISIDRWHDYVCRKS